MKLGLLSAILSDATLEEVIETASSLGLESVELACWPAVGEKRRYAGVSHIDVDTLDERRVDEIKELLERYRMTISSLGYYPNPLSSDKAQNEFVIEHIYKLIDASKKLGVNMITTFIGRDPKKNLEETFVDFVDVWKMIVEYAETMGVRIAIENCPMLFSSDEWPGGKNLAVSPQIFRKMFDLIPSPYFGLNFDPSHYVWQQMDYTKTIIEFKDRIFHIHLKDIKVYRERLDDVGILALPLAYMEPKIPGRGDINWRLFLNTLKDIEYSGHCIIEIEDREYEDSRDRILESIRLSIMEVKKYI